MRSLTFAISLLLAITLGIVATQLVHHRNQARDQRAELEALRSRNAQLEEDLARREVAVREAEQLAATGVAEIHRVRRELAAARAVEAARQPDAGKPEVPRTRAVPAYLGEELLGQVWTVPRNVAKDPETGEFTFDTVVVLDEKLRRKFTVTNLVEREVIRTETVQNHNYIPPAPAYYPYNYYYPRVTHGGGTWDEDPRPPGPDPSPTPTLPSPPRVGGSGWGTIWTPPARK